jgi:N-acetyltransferase 10
MGYGGRALQLLQHYYEGKITNISEFSSSSSNAMDVDSGKKKSSKSSSNEASSSTDKKLSDEDIKPRKDLPPLLLKLSERPAERLNYLGVSFGVTPALFSYWKKAGFVPVYMRLTPNELTGEHTMIMLYQSPETQEVAMSCSPDWLFQFNEDFRKRFLSLLSYEFRSLSCESALLIQSVRVPENLRKSQPQAPLTRQELESVFSIHDIKRLEGYANSLLDYHVIIDLFPALSRLFFMDRLPKTLSLTPGQSLFLIGLGQQHKTVDEIAKELGVEASQVMSYLQKIVRRCVKIFKEMEEKDEMQKLPQYLTTAEVGMNPLAQTLDEDLAAEESGEEDSDEEKTVESALRKKHNRKRADKETERQQQELLDSLTLSQYAISDTAQDWSGNAAIKKNTIPNMISVRVLQEEGEGADQKHSKFSKDRDSKGKPNPKKRKFK